MRKNLIFGADPEFFAAKNGEIIPGTMLIPSTIDTGWGYITNDGIVLEINPFPGEIQRLLDNLMGLVDVAMRETGCELIFEPRYRVSEAIIELAGTYDTSALEFGCSPDRNIYDDAMSARMDASKHPWRYAGGHIHIASGKMDPWLVISSLECELSDDINANSSIEEEYERRKYYGRAGCFRKKPYGAEWRTPSAAIFKSIAGSNYNVPLSVILSKSEEVIQAGVERRLTEIEDARIKINGYGG